MMEESFFIDTPLMMISTWDGDEFALACYHRAMTKIKNDSQSFLDTRNQFEECLKKHLKPYRAQSMLENGRGVIQGPLPTFLQQFFDQNKYGFIVDPNYSAMRRFIKL